MGSTPQEIANLIGPGLARAVVVSKVDGNLKDLNYPIELKSQIELGYEFHNHYRLSADFSHLSNVSLSHTRNKSNPGAESAFISLHIPFNYFH